MPRTRTFVLVELAIVLARAATASGDAVRIVHEFQSAESNPVGPLASDGRGNLYGMTAVGGASGGGIVFTIRPDGTGYEVLHEFAGGPGDGREPQGSLVADGSGRLYGVTRFGGAGDLGTVFRMREDGGGFEVVHAFESLGFPLSLVGGGDGFLYGTTSTAVFRVATDGAAFAVLHRFVGGPSDGRDPVGALVVERGVVYGATTAGGQPVVTVPKYGYIFDGNGTVYSLRTDGSGFTILSRFLFAGPAGGLAADRAGVLYGFTRETLYRVAPDGGEIEFVRSLDAEMGIPVGSPLPTTSGDLFAETDAGILRMKSDGTQPVVLHRSQAALDGSTTVGISLSDDGTILFRVMREGGATNAGVLSRIEVDGSGFAVFHAFPGYRDSGSDPNGVTAAFGAIYGTTRTGGPWNKGLLYRVRADGSGFTSLHAFAGGAGDGVRPWGRVAADALGRLYGATVGGGAQDAGTLFRIQSDGSDFRILHSFERPVYDVFLNPSNLIESAGRLYGTTDIAGEGGNPAIFSVGADGNDYRVLKEFAIDPATGMRANVSTLATDPAGSLYGAVRGGIGGLGGVLFTLRSDGTQFRVLYRFGYGSSDGWDARALVLARPGVLVGATSSGGDFGNGALFRIGTDGSSYRVLHSLVFGETGNEISALLTRDGAVWAAPRYGGAFGDGTLLEFAIEGPLRVLRRFGPGSPDGPHPGTIGAAAGGELVGTSFGSYPTDGTLFAIPDGLSRPASGGSGGAVRRP